MFFSYKTTLYNRYTLRTGCGFASKSNKKEVFIIQTEIQKRLQREFNAYKAELLNLKPEHIFDKSYETATKKEIMEAFVSEESNNKKILEYLASFDAKKDLLNHLYTTWIDASDGIRHRLSGIIPALEIKLEAKYSR